MPRLTKEQKLQEDIESLNDQVQELQKELRNTRLQNQLDVENRAKTLKMHQCLIDDLWNEIRDLTVKNYKQRFNVR